MVTTLDTPQITMKSPAVTTENVNLFYGPKQALKNINFFAPKKQVTAMIGPSGCGKSTFLRCLNRMNDRVPNVKTEGKFVVDGIDPYAKKVDLMKLRRHVGMLFQKPNPFPGTIYDNVALAVRLHYGLKGKELDDLVQKSLEKVALWDEVKDDYRRKSALELSGGQQQRLCMARMLAVEPRVLLMDEPCSALDPISTARIEELIMDLSSAYTVILVTHNLHQAMRVSHNTAFFMMGELIEMGPTHDMFEGPKERVTADYLSGRFG